MAVNIHVEVFQVVMPCSAVASQPLRLKRLEFQCHWCYVNLAVDINIQCTIGAMLKEQRKDVHLQQAFFTLK